MADLTVRKVFSWMPIQLDDDGTPMPLGQRLVEVRSGEWVDPLMADMMEMIASDQPST